MQAIRINFKQNLLYQISCFKIHWWKCPWSTNTPQSQTRSGSSVPESIGLLVPAQLSPDAVRNSSDKLPTQAKLWAQLQGKLLWWVLLLWHVPLKLVYEGDVSYMDIQLEIREEIGYLIPLSQRFVQSNWTVKQSLKRTEQKPLVLQTSLTEFLISVAWRQLSTAHQGSALPKEGNALTELFHHVRGWAHGCSIICHLGSFLNTKDKGESDWRTGIKRSFALREAFVLLVPHNITRETQMVQLFLLP